MNLDLRDVPTLLLPGTGSDDNYALRAFAPALTDAGAIPVPHRPQPEALLDGYFTALMTASQNGPIAVAGISLGAAVAVTWALGHPDRVVGVLAALPAWTGRPDDAPAAAAARASAAELRRDGLAAATARMQQSSPAWLADELTRSWAAQWPQLPDAMVEAAGFVAPTVEQLAALAVPLGVSAAVDDPIHPIEVGTEWATTAPRGALQTVTLAQFGADPAALGWAGVAALNSAAAD